MTITSTECSLWSTWVTMGTIAEMAPFLAVLGVTMQERAPLRRKSPEPPMPFISCEPMTWVELTWP